MTIGDRMGSYIVRMYGDAVADGETFIGIAQDIEQGKAYPFKGPGDLWEILTTGHPRYRPETGDDAPGPAGTSPGGRPGKA